MKDIRCHIYKYNLVEDVLFCSDDNHQWYNHMHMDDVVIKKLDSFFSPYPSQAFKKGTIIIQAGEEPSGIFYIESGIMRSYWISSNGFEVTQNMYKPHAFLPMSWAVAGVTNNSFYEAMTHITARKAPKEAVLTFLKKEPDVLFDLLRRIYIGMEGLWMHFESITAGNSTTKLIASLVILAKRFGKQEKDGVVIQLKMSEHDVANYAGIARETASRELQKLKKERIVSFEKGTILVHDIHKIEDMLLQ